MNGGAPDPRIPAEQVRTLFARTATAQATTAVNAVVVAWVFWGLVPRARTLAWLAALCSLAVLRLVMVRAYRRGRAGAAEATTWALRFTAAAALTGACWGAAALVFYSPRSPIHQVFLVFVLGGMTAGAALSNASFAPAFVAFAVPALLPMVIRLGADRDGVHAAMAFMLIVFGAGVTWLSRVASRAQDEALRLRLRDEGLVADLTAARQRLERLNTDLELRVAERTAELERTLRLRIASEARLAVTLRSIGEGVVATDARGVVTLFNRTAETLTGSRAEEAIGRAVTDVVHVLDDGTGQPAPLPVGRVLDEAVPVGPGHHVLVARDGSQRPVTSTLAPIREASGPTVGLVLVFGDRTEERRAEEALREADRRKNQFISLLSHELRNPLAAIRSSLYLLEHAPGDSEGASRAREVVHRQTEHLTRLVEDLLDVTRIAQGKIELRRGPVDVGLLARSACDDYALAFKERGIELRCEPLCSDAWIDADERRIAQVLGNLLHNAAKFTRDGGHVVVAAGGSGEQAEIRVRDDGVGISPELLPRLFEPFVQADGVARTKGGLGLGLALTRRLVELHGGSVRAHSEGPDRGAEFVLTFPLAPAPERPAPPAAAPAPRGAPSTVLIIEDDRDTARSIAEVLKLEGHRVHVVSTGRAGIAKAREVRPEVVLCDIGLPDVDGYEVARALRADGALASTHLVALSGHALPEDRQRAAEAGFDEHISKPASIDVILASVQAR
jgi:PAS domain S-box-containing protein